VLTITQHICSKKNKSTKYTQVFYHQDIEPDSQPGCRRTSEYKSPLMDVPAPHAFCSDSVYVIYG